MIPEERQNIMTEKSNIRQLINDESHPNCSMAYAIGRHDMGTVCINEMMQWLQNGLVNQTVIIPQEKIERLIRECEQYQYKTLSEKLIYVADDGTEFENKDDLLKYTGKKKMQAAMPEYRKGAYYCRTAEDFAMAMQKFISDNNLPEEIINDMEKFGTADWYFFFAAPKYNEYSVQSVTETINDLKKQANAYAPFPKLQSGIMKDIETLTGTFRDNPPCAETT